jgi:hypothetical protein
MPCPKCGSIATTITSGSGPHAAALRCGDCGRWLQWIGKDALSAHEGASPEEEVHPFGRVQVSFVCDRQFYWHAMYTSLTFTCVGSAVAISCFDDALGQDTVWHLCSGHATRLLLCHRCMARPISPYAANHLCVSCADNY